MHQERQRCACVNSRPEGARIPIYRYRHASRRALGKHSTERLAYALDDAIEASAQFRCCTFALLIWSPSHLMPSSMPSPVKALLAAAYDTISMTFAAQRMRLVRIRVRVSRVAMAGPQERGL